ncbi:MAG: hypothetical protein C4567_07995 [Deltaproteobacteria bacterium]|nr:MAG: hypothetical protein C4567_07995 [Deltaproteobacteria bacterium]
MKGSFNDRVRQAVAARFRVGEVFKTAQAREVAELATPEGPRVWTALRDLARHGELEALGQGRWRRLEREERPELREIMWRLLRIHLVMTVEKMTLQSGASPKTAHEFFETCMRQGLVVNEEKHRGRPGRYRLVKDVGPEPPPDAKNAEKLRQLRAKKQQEILRQIDGIFAAVAELRLAVSQMEEG